MTKLYWIFLAVFATSQDGPPPAVQVTGAVKQLLTLTAADLAKVPRASARISANEGVPLHEILKKADVPQGSELCGKALASCVWAEGQDHYQVVFSAAALDPSFLDHEILLADTANGKTLDGALRRFRLVASRTNPALARSASSSRSKSRKCESSICENTRPKPIGRSSKKQGRRSLRLGAASERQPPDHLRDRSRHLCSEYGSRAEPGARTRSNRGRALFLA